MSQKGSAFEREICRKLSLHWSNGKRDDIFWRSNASGARAKIRSKKGKSTFGQYGDIQANDPYGQDLIDFFTIELKRGYKGASIADVIDKGDTAAKQKWEEFLDQVTADHDNAKSLYWLLITKRDRREIMAFFPIKLWQALKTKENRKEVIPYVIAFIPNYGGIVGMQFEKLLGIINRKKVREILREQLQS